MVFPDSTKSPNNFAVKTKKRDPPFERQKNASKYKEKTLNTQKNILKYFIIQPLEN